MNKSDLIQAASLGLEIAVTVFLGAFIGYKADERCKSGPWGMVAGLVIGSVVGLWSAYKLAVKKDERA